MFLNKTFKLYAENFKLALVFGILLVFVALFILLPNAFFSSGSIFLEYNSNLPSWDILALEIVGIILFIALYSVFVTLIVFGVRKEMSSVKVEYYLREMVQKFSTKVFFFYLLFVFLLFLLATALTIIGTSIFVVNAVLLVIAILFLFTPQSIVVDEGGIASSVYHNWEFIAKHPGSFILVLVISFILLAAIQLVELAVDYLAFFLGSFVSIALVLLIVVPFIEVLKTQSYLMKFGMLEGMHSFESKHGL